MLSEQELRHLPEREFAAIWEQVVGEPPAIVIERPIMVTLLMQFADFDQIAGRLADGGCSWSRRATTQSAIREMA